MEKLFDAARQVGRRQEGQGRGGGWGVRGGAQCISGTVCCDSCRCGGGGGGGGGGRGAE